MSIDELVKKTPFPNTRESITHDLKTLGLSKGDVVIVHSSLSSLGWTIGGAVAVVQALQDVLTPEGTLVMPMHSSDNSDPAEWSNPPVPEDWWQTIRDHTPAFDPDYTPTSYMGDIVECFRNFPDVRRSYHPHVSFGAWGKHRDLMTENHSLDFGLSEESALGKLYKLDGKILLLGVSHANNTSLHLAENRSDYSGKKTLNMASAIFKDGERVWQSYLMTDGETDDFDTVGDAYEKSIGYEVEKVGLAECRLLSQRELVDFAVPWFMENRKAK